jgi:hypothetical protein
LFARQQAESEIKCVRAGIISLTDFSLNLAALSGIIASILWTEQDDG